MAFIYEHWRPDTNECFYVGASRVGEVRANDFSSRNKDYKSVLNELETLQTTPFTRIVYDNLEDDCVEAYEKIRIAFRRAELGKKLTNIMNGGDGFYISSELNSKLQKEAQNRPEVNAKRSASLVVANAKPEVRKRRSLSAVEAHARPEVTAARKSRETCPELREKRKASARLGGLKAGQKSSEELSTRGKKAAETRRIRKLEQKNGK